MLGITDFWTYVIGVAAIILLPGPNSIFVLTVGARFGVRAGYRAMAGVFVGDAVLMTLSAAGVASLLRTYPPVFLIIKYAGAAYLLWVGLGIIRGALRGLRKRVAPPGTPPAATSPAWTGPTETDHADIARTENAHARTDCARTEHGATEHGATEHGATEHGATEHGATGQAGAASAGVGELRRPFRRAAVISLLNPKAILFFVSFFIQFVEPGYPYPALSFLVLAAVVQLFSGLYLTALIFGGRFLAGQFQRRRRLAAGAAGGVGALFVGFGIKLATASVN